jgi:DNA-binding PadR family transcriptional regulator
MAVGGEARELTPRHGVVLACIAQRPSCGYEIAGRIKEGGNGGRFARQSAGSVYHSLRRLEQLGYVAAAPGAAPEQRRITTRCWDHRRWLSATPAGVHALSKWICEQAQPTVQAEIHTRIEAAARRGTVALSQALDDCEGICAEREEMLGAILMLAAGAPQIGARGELVAIATRRGELGALRSRIQRARGHLRGDTRRSGSGAQEDGRSPRDAGMRASGQERTPVGGHA